MVQYTLQDQISISQRLKVLLTNKGFKYLGVFMAKSSTKLLKLNYAVIWKKSKLEMKKVGGGGKYDLSLSNHFASVKMMLLPWFTSLVCLSFKNSRKELKHLFFNRKNPRIAKFLPYRPITKGSWSIPLLHT